MYVCEREGEGVLECRTHARHVSVIVTNEKKFLRWFSFFFKLHKLAGISVNIYNKSSVNI